MADDPKDGHSSGEYSGVLVETAGVAVKGNAQDLLLAISSGQEAQKRRKRAKDEKAQENKEEEGTDAGDGGKK